MATSIEYIEYVCDCINGVGDIRYKKMFGEFMIYVNEKPILLVCDSIVYVKKINEIEDKMHNAEVGFPYKGAKERYILDIENIDFAKSIIAILEKHTLVPKRKRKLNK